MKTIYALFLLLAFQSVTAQSSHDSLPAYERINTIPPFKLMTAPDSSAFTLENLKKKKPVIFIVFSPDCEHCKHFTKEMLEKYALLKKAQVVMSSMLPYELIRKFYETDRIADYERIKMGQDPTNFLGTFFNVRSFPTVVVYNKKGKFVKRFDGAITIEKIAAEL